MKTYIICRCLAEQNPWNVDTTNDKGKSSFVPGFPSPPAAGAGTQPGSDVPAPQSPEGRRPVCIQSLFILCSSLRAVMDTSWFLSPNSSMCANRGIYKHGSATERNTIMSNPNVDLGNRQRGCCACLASPQQTQTVLLGRFSTTKLLDNLKQNNFLLYKQEIFKALHKHSYTLFSIEGCTR